MKEEWQKTFLNAGTKELDIDCSILISTVSNILEKQKQEFINGYRCLGCGKKTDTALADWCNSCMETK